MSDIEPVEPVEEVPPTPGEIAVAYDDLSDTEKNRIAHKINRAAERAQRRESRRQSE